MTGNGLSRQIISDYSQERASWLENHHLPQWVYGTFIAPADGTYTFETLGDKDYSDDYHQPMKIETYGYLTLEVYTAAANASASNPLYGLAGISTAPALSGNLIYAVNNADANNTLTVRQVSLPAMTGDLLRILSADTANYIAPSCTSDYPDDIFVNENVFSLGSVQDVVTLSTENLVPQLFQMTHSLDGVVAAQSSGTANISMMAYGDTDCIGEQNNNTADNLQVMRFSQQQPTYRLMDTQDITMQSGISQAFGSTWVTVLQGTVKGKRGDIVRATAVSQLIWTSGTLGLSPAECYNVIVVPGVGLSPYATQGLSSNYNEAQLDNTYAFTLLADGTYTFMTQVSCSNPTGAVFTVNSSGVHMWLDHFSSNF